MTTPIRIHMPEPRAREPLVVKTHDLAKVLYPWMRTHEAEHNALFQGYGESEYEMFGFGSHVREAHDAMKETGSVRYLCEHTGLKPRALWRIMHGETQCTALSIADALLNAIGREYMLSNGEITVIPNPRFSLEHWVEIMQERGCF